MKNEEDKKQEVTKEQLLSEYLEVIDGKLEVYQQIKSIFESSAQSSKKSANLTQNYQEQLQELFIKSEALSARERALFNTIFGTAEEV